MKRQQKRFSFSFAAALAVHILLLILFSVYQHDKPLPKKGTPKIMDVVLLDEKKTPPKKANKDARTISNRNAVGGSNKARDKRTRHAKAPARRPQPKRIAKPMPKPVPPKPVPPKAQTTPTPPTPRKAPPAPVREMPTLAKRARIPTPHRHIPKPKPVRKKIVRKKTPPVVKRQVPLANLMPSAMALSQLSRDFERERRMKQRLTREADIPINTKQVKYAPYAHALVRALEDQWRPGRANYDQYSEHARQALVKLTIEHDGSLSGIEILRPSPIARINDSAIEAIRAAAPFRILPSSWGLDRVSFYLTFEVVEDGFVFHQM